jgi:hypothetical protein
MKKKILQLEKFLICPVSKNAIYRKHLKIASPEKLLKMHAALSIQARNLNIFKIFF